MPEQDRWHGHEAISPVPTDHQSVHVGDDAGARGSGAIRHSDQPDSVSPAAPGMADPRDEELERLRGQIDRLSAENQALQSRVVELQETSRTQQVRIDELLGRLDERATADDDFHLLQVARAEGRIRMSESYAGVVEDVHEDTVVVVYDLQGDIIEQTYERSQFLEARLPEVGTLLTAHVMVSEVEARVDEPVAVEDERDDDVPSYRRKPLDEPTIF